MASSSASLLAKASDTDLLEPIRDISRALVHRLAPQLVAAGLAPSTFWPLHHLDQGHGRHPGELARRLGVSPATCTASVDQLVAFGYVVRRPSPSDRRQVLLAVTPKGRRALDSVWRGFDRSLRDVLRGIPFEDVRVTARTIRAIAERLARVEPALAAETRP